MAKNITIPRDLVESVAFRQLPSLEYRLLIELIALQQDGKAPGVQCSVTWAAKVCCACKSPAGRALTCLEERGFIVRIGSSGLGGAVQWRVTCLPFLGEPATHDYSDTIRVALHPQTRRAPASLRLLGHLGKTTRADRRSKHHLQYKHRFAELGFSVALFNPFCYILFRIDIK
jgi:hypothetical protein